MALAENYVSRRRRILRQAAAELVAKRRSYDFDSMGISNANSARIAFRMLFFSAKEVVELKARVSVLQHMRNVDSWTGGLWGYEVWLTSPCN